MKPDQILFANLCAALGYSHESLERSDYERKLDITVKRGINGEISWISGEWEKAPRSLLHWVLDFDGYGDASTRETLLALPGIDLHPEQHAIAYVSILTHLIQRGYLKCDLARCRESMLCGPYGADALKRFDRIDHATRRTLADIDLPHHAPSAALAASIIQRIANR